MTLRIASVVLVLSSLVLAKPATRPAKPPATRPVAVAKAPGSQPATRPAALSGSSFARDIINKFKEQKQKEQQQLKVAYIDLDQPIIERPPFFTIFGDNTISLQSLITRLHQARDDKDVRAVLLNFGETDLNLAQAQEIRDAIIDIRKADKRTFVYADSYDTTSYIAATGSKDICMLSGGEIVIPGVGMETLFAKGLLDKVGVKADYVQIGQYKGADEQFTRTEPSKEFRGELNKILDSIFEQIIDGIANNRNMSRFDVQDMINGVVISGKLAKTRSFVDHLVDQDGLRDLLKKELGRDVDLLHDYGKPQREPPDFSSPFALLSFLGRKPEQESNKPQVALIYAEGIIVDGEGSDGIFTTGTVGSEDLRKALRVASRDENVHAIVLRIDSPGGSASASEVIWQAARRVAGEKPVIVSVGGMAASGGYYIASAGDYIFADPSAIVGSIGVVGGKFVLKDLFEKIGVHTEDFTRGANANLFSMNQPFSDLQRRLVTNWMQQTYDQFVDRVLTTRQSRIKDIDDVAHGRIFLAKQARQLGMVDELGGIDKAVAYAAEEAELDPGTYDVRVIPSTKTIADLLRGADPETAMPFRPSVSIAPDSILRTLSPSTAKLVRQQLQQLQLLQRRPVILACPYVITVK